MASASIDKNKTSQFLGHIAALIVVTMWGYSFVSSRVLLDNGLGAVQIFVLRFILAYTIMIFISHSRLMARNFRDEMLFFMCGLLAGSVYFIAENTALEYTLTTNVSLLTSLSPLITALLVSVIYKNEKLGKGTWIGSAIAVVGVACVVFNSSLNLQVRPLGDLLSITAALSWAIYSIVLRQLNANYDVWFISRKTFFYGLITAVPFLIFEPHSCDLITTLKQPTVWGNLLFLGLGASTIAYVLWAFSVKSLGAVKANNYMYFQSIVTLIVSALLLGEKITFVGTTGICLILGGLWLGDKLNERWNKTLSSHH